MYQGRLWLFRGDKRRRRITLIFILVLILFNTCFLYSQNNDKIKLNNLNIKVEDLKNAFNPAVNKFNEKTISTIIIDPGHGGKDPGAIGVNKLFEKDVVLSFSLELKKELEELFPDVKIVLTRTNDIYPTLEERFKIANEAAKINTDKSKNALFVSVHANASFSTSARGFEAYFVSAQESSEYARAVSMFENNALVKFDNIDTSRYENDSSQITHNYMLIEQYQKESRLLAESITDEVLKVSGVARRTKPVQNALFYVLKGAIMPSTLIELGFITNPEDAKLMNTKETRLKMVKATADGIKKYIELFEKTKGFTK
ncbi:N-acetylmuramoyl-L-alanine amidase [Brachyspira innocens]|uniref:N-acetylmuramoyl-L-alanine amidase n=1 Tax=Brachyspira innocens TaxID=13264 RepID=A0ABT8Z128_9SPIR|nr:N-acetylmuramoyl-L-alanine amidase [Brachyspira innocens]MDO6994188.1 N-acetylmuramoyl-L-alanine amidase [Brachyspira innocens]MDO7021198.1 N-acetylmuramoyl-L-alanine amidase [Brachyspira innocens]